MNSCGIVVKLLSFNRKACKPTKLLNSSVSTVNSFSFSLRHLILLNFLILLELILINFYLDIKYAN